MTKISTNDLKALVNETVAKKLEEISLTGIHGPARNPAEGKQHVDAIVADMKKQEQAGQLTDPGALTGAIRNGKINPADYEYMYSSLEKQGLGQWADRLRRFLEANKLHRLAPGVDVKVNQYGEVEESMQKDNTRITEQELRALIGEAVARKLADLREGVLLKEAEEKSEPGTQVPSAKAVVAFAKKVDDFITKTIEEARKLADDAEDIIDPNLLNAPETGTRNELVIHRIGTLRTIANALASFFERVRRTSP